MANSPYIKELAFKRENGDDGLQRDKRKKNKVTVTGLNLSKNDIVFVVSTSGAIWIGFLDETIELNKVYRCNKLKRIEIDITKSDTKYSNKADKSTRIKEGSENVSTTVTNPTTGPSPPAPPQPVEVIP